MPLHDWTKVDPNIYHQLHGRWIFAIQEALNGGLLPPEFYALAEQVTVPFGPDVLALEFASPQTAEPQDNSNSQSLLVAEPKVQVLERSSRSKLKTRNRRRLAIRHNSGHRVAAVIEITSPSNKSRRDELSTFVQKAVEYLEQGIHLLVIDLFPPSKWDKHGLHAAIWKKFRERAAPRPSNKPLTLVSYQANDTVTAYFEPVAVGDSLIEMPLFLTATQYVNVPLEQTYQVAWNSVPKFWQDVVTR